MRRSQNRLLLYIFLIFHIFRQIIASTPKRLWQNTIYDETSDRIIFLGGVSESGENTQQIYSLSLTESFNRSSIQLESMPDLPIPVSDSATALTKDGHLYVIGGTQGDCTTSVVTQMLDTQHNTWTVNSTTGVLPGPRQGARAVMLQDEIYYFGGQSLVNCSSNQYYYNSLYKLNPSTNNWTVHSDALPPVAQSRMTMNAIDTDSLLLFGGESVSANSRATWVAMSQLAIYNASTSSWSYASVLGNISESMGRSGHSSVNNGTHTFVFGGALGSTTTSPTFLSLSGGPSSFTSSSLDYLASGVANAPPALYGHTATLTSNGIMVIATGLIGTSSSMSYNDQIYLYDTIDNQWLDVFEPSAHLAPIANKSVRDLSLGTILGSTSGALAVCILALFLRQKFRKRRLARNHEYEKGLEYPISNIRDHEEQHDQVMLQNRSHLPTWAAIHACQARSGSPNAWPPRNELSNIEGQRHLALSRLSSDYHIQDIQFALPSTPRVMAFAAPQLLLRVVNPDATTSIEPETKSDVLKLDSTPISSKNDLIENEEDLENLRSHVATGLKQLNSHGTMIVPGMTTRFLSRAGCGLQLDPASLLSISGDIFEPLLPPVVLKASNTADDGWSEVMATSLSQSSANVASPASSTGSLRSFSYSPYLDNPTSIPVNRSPRSDGRCDNLNRKPSSSSTDSQTSLLWWH